MSYIRDNLYVNTENGKELSYLEFINASNDNKITIGSKYECKRTKITKVVFSKAVLEKPYVNYYVMFEYQIGSANTDEGEVTLNVVTDWFAVVFNEYDKLLGTVLDNGFKHQGTNREDVPTWDFWGCVDKKYTDKHEEGISKELTLDDKDSSIKVVEKEYIVHDALITITSINGKELTYKASEFTALTADFKLGEYAFYTTNEDYPHFIAKEDFYNLSDYFNNNEFLRTT